MSKIIKGVRYPKDAIHWWLVKHDLSQAWLAKIMGRPEKTLSEIMSCKASVTAQTAMEVEKVTGIKAEFLLQLQANLDLDKQRYPEVFKIEKLRDLYADARYSTPSNHIQEESNGK